MCSSVFDHGLLLCGKASHYISIETIPDLFGFLMFETLILNEFPSEEDKKRFEMILSTIYDMKLDDLCNLETVCRERIWNDVRVVEYAVRASASHLVTEDEENIRRKKKEIEKEFGIRIRNLDEMNSELDC